MKDWTRDRFGLPEDTVVAVSETQCRVPGCPPVQTVITFWGPDGTRYRIKLFKPTAEIVSDHLPVRWLLPSLIDYGDAGCDCC